MMPYTTRQGRERVSVSRTRGLNPLDPKDGLAGELGSFQLIHPGKLAGDELGLASRSGDRVSKGHESTLKEGRAPTLRKSQMTAHPTCPNEGSSN